MGPATAQSIIDYREENGDFEMVDDLVNVPGIGEVTLNEIKDFIKT
ncbi:MAG: helix-hairpin-helix domain-containing protein [Candidatus Izimaplasma sp.]|nr:helix-hairpin-helix domain-containing protein [Candidatus Izimaplasma bacterium]